MLGCEGGEPDTSAEIYCAAMCRRTTECGEPVDSYCTSRCEDSASDLSDFRPEYVQRAADCIAKIDCLAYFQTESFTPCWEVAVLDLPPSDETVAFCRGWSEKWFECGGTYFRMSALGPGLRWPGRRSIALRLARWVRARSSTVARVSRRGSTRDSNRASCGGAFVRFGGVRRRRFGRLWGLVHSRARLRTSGLRALRYASNELLDHPARAGRVPARQRAGRPAAGDAH